MMVQDVDNIELIKSRAWVDNNLGEYCKDVRLKSPLQICRLANLLHDPDALSGRGRPRSPYAFYISLPFSSPFPPTAASTPSHPIPSHHVYIIRFFYFQRRYTLLSKPDPTYLRLPRRSLLSLHRAPPLIRLHSAMFLLQTLDHPPLRSMRGTQRASFPV